MPERPARRKPATELELKLSAGRAVDLDELVAIIDKPMHDELVAVFRNSLTQDEREDLARDVLVELSAAPTKYDVTRGSLVRYAKMRVRTLALDYIQDRKRAWGQQRLFEERAHLELVSSVEMSPLESEESNRAFALAVERVRLVILQLPREQQLAAQAYERYGPNRFASVLARELGISANLVSQWWTRAKRKIREAIGPDFDVLD